MYKHKYEKYKQKYLGLKAIQEGGDQNIIHSLSLDRLLTVNLDTIDKDVMNRLINSVKQPQTVFNHSISVLHNLAEGGFGKIFLVRCLKKIDGLQKDEFAIIKTFEYKPQHNGNTPTMFAEYETVGLVISNMSKCTVPKIYAYFEQGYENHPTILMQYVKGTSLTQIAHHMQLNNESLSHLDNWINQLKLTLQCLHNKHIVHRDIKTDNIMITSDMKKVVLVDYGLTCMYGTLCSPVYSARNRCPLKISEKKINIDTEKRNDWYSFGLLILDVLAYFNNIEPFSRSVFMYSTDGCYLKEYFLAFKNKFVKNSDLDLNKFFDMAEQCLKLGLTSEQLKDFNDTILVNKSYSQFKPIKVEYNEKGFIDVPNYVDLSSGLSVSSLYEDHQPHIKN